MLSGAFDEGCRVIMALAGQYMLMMTVTATSDIDTCMVSELKFYVRAKKNSAKVQCVNQIKTIVLGKTVSRER